MPASGIHYSHMHLRLVSIAILAAAPLLAGDRVKTQNGVVETNTPPAAGVRSFKGIPFAQPPVGPFRWREPQPPKNWTGIRNSDEFGPRCMQRTGPNADYWFRSNGMNEDCL